MKPRCVLLSALLLAPALLPAASDTPKPNILLMVADDLGCRTPSCPIPEPPNDGPVAANPKTNYLPIQS